MFLTRVCANDISWYDFFPFQNGSQIFILVWVTDEAYKYAVIDRFNLYWIVASESASDFYYMGLFTKLETPFVTFYHNFKNKAYLKLSILCDICITFMKHLKNKRPFVLWYFSKDIRNCTTWGNGCNADIGPVA